MQSGISGKHPAWFNQHVLATKKAHVGLATWCLVLVSPWPDMRSVLQLSIPRLYRETYHFSVSRSFPDLQSLIFNRIPSFTLRDFLAVLSCMRDSFPIRPLQVVNFLSSVCVCETSTRMAWHNPAFPIARSAPTWKLPVRTPYPQSVPTCALQPVAWMLQADLWQTLQHQNSQM